MNGVISTCCDPAYEKADMCDEDPGFGGRDGAIAVFSQPSASSESCECALDHSPARQDLEAFGAIRSLDDFQREASDLLQRSFQLRPGVAAVGKDMAQPRPASKDRFQHDRRTIAILNVGGMDDETDQQVERVDDDVTLAAHDCLSGVKAPNSAAFGGFYRPPADDTGRGAGFPPFLLTRHHHQFVAGGAQQTLVAPAIEVFLHRREWRKSFDRSRYERATPLIVRAGGFGPGS